MPWPSGTVLVLLVGVAACGDDTPPYYGAGVGSGSCSGTRARTWSEVDGPAILTLGADCSFAYDNGADCRSVGTYSAPLGDSGSVRVDISSATGLLCLPAGSHVCSYVYASGTLSFDCGGGTEEFE